MDRRCVDSFNIDDITTIDINNCTAWTDFILTPFPSPVIFSPYNLNLYCIGDSGLNNITACDSYTWRDGITYTTSNNTATHTLSNAAGCDSVFNLDLIINNSSLGTDVITACDSITWIDGVTYKTSNNKATYNLTNAVGCDSLVTIDLIINNSTSGTDVQTARNSITWIDGALIVLILMTLLPLI